MSHFSDFSASRVFPTPQCALIGVQEVTEKPEPPYPSRLGAPQSVVSRRMGGEEIGDLLRDAARGDSAAWSQLVDEFGGLVLSVARGYRLGDASTDDVVQTVWLRLAEHCHRINEPAKLAGWLATTTRNEAIRVQRSQARVAPAPDVDGDPVGLQRPLDESLLDSETHAEVLQAFRALDHETREFLSLVCTEPPLDYKTIAELTGRPVGSIGPTRARCLDKLRKAMAQQATLRHKDDQ